MLEEPFAEGRSVIHRCSPTVRVMLAGVYSCTVAVMRDPQPLTLALLLSAALVLLARLPFAALIRRLGAAAGLLVLVWLLVPWTYPGESFAQAGALNVSREGLLLCLQVTLKTFAILAAFTALVATMHLSALGHALHRLGLPDKLVQLLLLAYRYIFVIEQEYARLYRAAKMRNFRPGNNLHTYQTFAYLIGMLFVRASERARRVHLAMKCRGFNGRFHSLDQYPPTNWNVLLAGAILLGSALLIGFDLWR